jgi:hypothetical protein
MYNQLVACCRTFDQATNIASEYITKGEIVQVFENPSHATKPWEVHIYRIA